MSFEIRTPLFEGPFDLLLFFIQRDELDIYDIPIAKITKDFLEYIEALERMEMDVASEFILVAATLVRIKAKMLLPRVEKDEQGNDIDPREELIRHLLEYKKYRSVLDVFEQWEEGMLAREQRGNIKAETRVLEEALGVEAELQDVDLYKLLKVFQGVVARMEERDRRPVHKVIPYPYTQEGQQQYVLAKLSFQPVVTFQELMDEDFNKVAVIYNFLAVLELLAQQKIQIEVGEGYNNFSIRMLEDAA